MERCKNCGDRAYPMAVCPKKVLDVPDFHIPDPESEPMKFRMMTFKHDIYDETKDVPEGCDVVGASQENGYWSVLLVEHELILVRQDD